ncbi:MAG: hypothetical protein FWG91_11615 [Lachnospiraceae bacterium]|nr:hypothetical protein [Lachnospiraceae bacterium]
MKITVLSIMTAALVLLNAGLGLFLSDGGSPRFVENIYGEAVELFGDGIYKNNSTFTATIRKGSDLVMIFAAIGLLITTLKRNSQKKTLHGILHGGLIVSIFYYAATLAFETVYNQLFLLYIIMFSVAFFALLFTFIDLSKRVYPASKDGHYKKTAIFTMMSGCTVLVWLMDIIPGALTGTPPDFVSIYTTSPTIIIDIGLIFPTCIIAGIMLWQKKNMGYVLSPIMLIFLTVIAMIVIGQTAVQMAYGVNVPMYQLIGYVGSFVVFGIIAAIVSIRFIKNVLIKSEA